MGTYVNVELQEECCVGRYAKRESQIDPQIEPEYDGEVVHVEHDAYSLHRNDSAPSGRVVRRVT